MEGRLEKLELRKLSDFCFFQAEDGIRDLTVTGVQTCALPILRAGVRGTLKFINLTRRTEIGANSCYLEAAGHHLVLDCGMHPKFAGEEALPNLKALGDRRLDAIIISHSHQDHIGTLPVLMRRQPQARVFMTEPTAEIGDVLLHNSVNVMTRQREEMDPVAAGLYPLFTHRETDRAAEVWQYCAPRQ